MPDPGLATRVARDYAIFFATRVGLIALLAVTVMSAGLGIWIATLSGEMTLLILACALAALGVVIIGMTFFLTRTAVARAYPPGEPATLELSEDALIAGSFHGRSELKYHSIRRVWVRPASVVMQLRSLAGAHVVFPRELFQDDDLARLNALVAAARATRPPRSNPA